MKPVTAGERLYLHMRDEILDLCGKGSMRWANAGILFDTLSGGPDYLAYVKGAAAIHATRRLLRYWSDERESVSEESQHVRKVAIFVRTEMFPSIGDEVSRRIARAVIEAERASRQSISRSCRTEVLRERKQQFCYLCGHKLDAAAKEGSSNHLSLEHLWPMSLGGDSIEENLLPACDRCQIDTQDTVSWEWPNIHNLVLPSSPSTGAMNSVNRSVRYARHYLSALRSCEGENLSLKQAFIRIGPMNTPVSHSPTGLPVTFFDLLTA